MPRSNDNGMPALMLPLGFPAEGLPLGLQMAAEHLCEESIHQAAAAHEDAITWCRTYLVS